MTAQSDLPTGMQLTALDPVFRETPHVYFDRLRADEPVHHDAELGRLFLTSAAEVAALLKDRNLSVDPRNAAEDSFTARLRGLQDPDELSMLSLDDPDHKRLRGLVNQAFNQRAIEAMRPRIGEIATALLDAIDAAAPFDLIAAYASPLPTIVIAEMLGIDPADRADFRRWSGSADQAFNPFRSEEERATILQSAAELSAYLERVTEERRADPGEDMISGMILADADGARMTTQEIVVMCRLLLVAGNVTTTDLIGNGVVALLRHPDQLARLRAEPALIANAVEEMLRYDPPVVQTGRLATGDRDVGGLIAHKGDTIMPSLLAAAHDPALNPDPGRFDVGRDYVRHFAFGGGAHFCLGAPLARAEAQIALPLLFARFPALQLAKAKPLARKIAPAFNGFGEIWVEAKTA